MRNSTGPLPQRFGNVFKTFLYTSDDPKADLKAQFARTERIVLQITEKKIRQELELLLTDSEVLQDYSQSRQVQGIQYDSLLVARKDLVDRLCPLIGGITTLQFEYAAEASSVKVDKKTVIDRIYDYREEIEKLLTEADCPIRPSDSESSEENQKHFARRQFATTCITKSISAIGFAMADLIEQQRRLKGHSRGGIGG